KAYYDLSYQGRERPMSRSELDAIFIIDDTALLIQAKAGGLPEAARAGKPRSLAKAVEKTIGSAVEQVGRDLRYIQEESEPSFLTRGGPITIDKSKINRFIPVVITLSPMDPVTTALSLLSR